MNQTTIMREDLPPDLLLTRLVDHHGAWATLRSLAAVLLKSRRRRRDATTMSDHLRRDIGLPEQTISAPRLRDPWI